MVRYIGLPNRNKGAPLVLPGGTGGLTTHVMSNVTHVMSNVTQFMSAAPGAASIHVVLTQLNTLN